MKIFTELIRFLQHSRRKYPTVTTEAEADSTLHHFYEGLLSGQWQDEDEAALALYSKNRQHASFRKLKGRTWDLLVTEILLHDSGDRNLTDRTQALLTCQREWAAVRVLLHNNIRKPTAQLARRVLRRALKYEITSVATEAAHFLQVHYALTSPNKHKYQHYVDQYRTLEQQYLSENRVEALYAEVAMVYTNGQGVPTSGYLADNPEHMRIITQAATTGTYRSILASSALQIVVATQQNDYPAAIEQANAALTLLRQKPYFAGAALEMLHQQLIYLNVRILRYDTAAELLKEEIFPASSGTYHWYRLYTSRFQLAIRQKKYLQAAEIFQQVIRVRSVDAAQETFREIWEVFEAYLHFLIKAGQFNPQQLAMPLRRFRLSRFMNRPLRYAKNHNGLDVSILIFKNIYLLAKGDYGGVADQMEAMDKYRYRYLRDQRSIRSKTMMKMLTIIPKNKFHRSLIEQKTKKLYQVLLDNSPTELLSKDEVEVIPYEDLWLIILSTLKYD